MGHRHFGQADESGQIHAEPSSGGGGEVPSSRGRYRVLVVGMGVSDRIRRAIAHNSVHAGPVGLRRRRRIIGRSLLGGPIYRSRKHMAKG
jgi:hypothetical protein